MKCPLCNATIGTTHGEEIVTQCIVTLSTALHHMPVLTLRHLIDTINALARVALPDPFSWDNTKFALVKNPETLQIIFFTAK